MREVTAEMIERGRGPDPRMVQQRRDMASKIRATRERITSSGTGHRAFDLELVRQFAEARKSAAPVVMALSVIVACSTVIWAPPLRALIWLTLMASANALVYGFATLFLKDDEPERRLRAWHRKFILAEIVQGFAWASLVAILLPVSDESARLFVLFVLLTVAAMNAVLSAPIPMAVYCSLLPVTLAIVAFTQGRPTAAAALPLTIMAAATPIYFAVLAKRLYASTLDSLSLRMEKDELIAELEAQKMNSDEARRRAEEANLAKSRFLATMSHELRTPLNAILGFSEVMQNELFGQHAVPAYREYASDIHTSGEHLLKLINEILDLSRVEAGRVDLREESISIAHIVEDCQHLLSMRAQKRGINVVNSVEANLPRLWADERAVRQVALNLLTNAIKFTPQGGTVTIKVGWTAAGGQYVSIRDTGPGIPPEEIPVVLSSFGRGSMAHKNADEGSGLGLPIVKGLIELHGGTFVLKSEVRVGTEVIVIFPPERVMDALPQMDVMAEEKRAPRRFVRRSAA
ncbi:MULTISPECIES: ATP-binding protein [unclassified Beijerinckia]|uniref:sensor histidine kinase n=1 Tax=unclassified Beijerinckia TaxID=2638183 RepID=UPI000B8940E9|nr:MULTISPECIES: ATP-binding protein [unclassified Beijerinckia]MDH7796247.1 two-component system cell cycle sensor histidine kinase PleC [Beijerinckia sp. GAS462]